MSPEPFSLSHDSTVVLGIVLTLYTLAIVAWALWVSYPGRGRR